MTKNRKFINDGLKFILVIVSIALPLVFAIACTDQSGDVSDKPKRPQGVPESAFWVGGADGGVFIVVQKNKEHPSHIYYSEIYHDQTGEIWYKGRLAMSSKDQPSVDLSKPELFDSWDGDTLHLSDGRSLKAIDQQ